MGEVDQVDQRSIAEQPGLLVVAEQVAEKFGIDFYVRKARAEIEKIEQLKPK